MNRRSLAWFPFPLLCLAACATSTPQATSSPTATLFPFRPPTATPTPRAAVFVNPVATPGPSPTPLVHRVSSGDTLLGIALQYGVELADLLVANPGVNPRFLSIGQELLIPGPGGEPVPGLLPTPTPLPVSLEPVRCYSSPGNALRCVTSASTDLDFPIEGLIALITLYDSEGRPIRTEPAYSPLNVLQPGGLMPLLADFEPPLAPYAGAAASLQSAVPVSEAAERYLGVAVEILSAGPDPKGEVWEVSGRITLPADNSAEGASVSLLLIALSDGDEVLAFRLWQLDVRGQLDFNYRIASLGGEIDRVIASAEALRVP